MPQLAVRIDLRDLDAESIEAILFAAGAVAITFTDFRDDAILEPAPGEFRLWPSTRIEALFDAGDIGSAALAHLVARLAVALQLPPERLEAAALGDRAWEREALRDFVALRFGQRLWIQPSTDTRDLGGNDACVVQLDPGLAFGTGTHATTRLCLEWLEARMPRGATLIDFGCGSGVLALAAVALGAKLAHAFDIDPQALTATHDNAQRNAVADRMRVVSVAAELPDDADIIVANILAGPLCALARDFARHLRTGGRVVLCGLLQPQAAEVMDAYAPCFEIGEWRGAEGWVALEGVRTVAALRENGAT